MIAATPSSVPGGGTPAPSLAFYAVNGRWSLENEGVAPDIEVENPPAAERDGHDLQSCLNLPTPDQDDQDECPADDQEQRHGSLRRLRLVRLPVGMNDNGIRHGRAV